MAGWDDYPEVAPPTQASGWDRYPEVQTPASWEKLPPSRTFLKGVEQGIGDPAIGAMQLGARLLPGIPAEAAPAIDRVIADRQATIQASRPDRIDIDTRQLPGDPGASHLPVNTGKGPDFARGVGNMIGAAPLLPVGGPVVGGMATAATMPVVGGDFWLEKLKQIGTGAAAGATARALGGVIGPSLSPQKAMLSEGGVTMTPGMLAGKTAKTFEDRATSLPFTGSAIAGAQRESLESFNKATINRALAPIRETLPKDMAAGTQAVAAAGDKVEAVYGRLLPQAKLAPDQALAGDIQTVFQASSLMPEAQRAQLRNLLNDRVIDKFTKAGTLDGETLKTLQSELRTFAKNYVGAPDPAQRQLGDAVSGLSRAVTDAISRQNPAIAPGLKAADQAWANLVRVENAAGRRATSEGVFTPGDLLAAVKQGDPRIRHRGFSRGEALMQDWATAGQNVIGRGYPDSGTAGRGLQNTITGELTGIATLPAALPYTGAGMSLMNRWASPGGINGLLGLMLREGAPLAGAPAADVAR